MLLAGPRSALHPNTVSFGALAAPVPKCSRHGCRAVLKNTQML